MMLAFLPLTACAPGAVDLDDTSAGKDQADADTDTDTDADADSDTDADGDADEDRSGVYDGTVVGELALEDGGGGGHGGGPETLLCEGELTVTIEADGALHGEADCIDNVSHGGVAGPLIGVEADGDVEATWSVEFGPEPAVMDWVGVVGGSSLHLTLSYSLEGMGVFTATADAGR